MNYLAHGYRFLDDAYFLAGTAVPDWLSVVNRKVRARGHAASKLVEDPDPRTRQIAAGIIQHHQDDRWFHETRAFNETILQFAVELRSLLHDKEGFRPSFLGHVVVEVLIDATLLQRDPTLGLQYYRAIESVSGAWVQGVVNRVARVPTDQLEHWISKFCELRFLYDYLDDDKLLHRLGQVMQRVSLPPLDGHHCQQSLRGWLPQARRTVAQRCDLLLERPK